MYDLQPSDITPMGPEFAEVFDARLIDRIPQLTNTSCIIKKEIPFIPIEDFAEQSIFITWPESTPLCGGSITLSYASHFNKDGNPVGSDSVFVTSFVETFNSDTYPFQRNSNEGISAGLSLLATINEAAKRKQGGILHVDEANKYSKPLLERLQKLGIYFYCDQYGNRREEPVIMKHGTLYACKFPIENLGVYLEKFVIDEAVDKILQLEKEHKTTQK